MGATGTSVGFGYQGGGGSADLSDYAKLDAINTFTAQFNVFTGFISCQSNVNAKIFNANTDTDSRLGSVSGYAEFIQPFRGGSYKKLIIHCNNLLGTITSYTFPTAFVYTPAIVSNSQVPNSVVATLTNTTITLNGTSTTGFIILEGF